jgi:hypothetical protein
LKRGPKFKDLGYLRFSNLSTIWTKIFQNSRVQGKTPQTKKMENQ